MRLISTFTNLYPLWTLAASVVAFFVPDLFLWFSGRWIVWGLGIIMFGMGITLHAADFVSISKMPWAVAVGTLSHFTIMPLLGWSLASLLDLPAQFAVGLILVACCPNGTASNVVTYLARGNVALSVVMTAVNTILAIVMTPLLFKWLAGRYVPVDGWGMFLTTVQVVLLPVVLGVILNQRFPRAVGAVSSLGPLISVAVIVLIAGSIVAQNADAIAEYGGQLALAGALLHGLGFLFGYAAARVCFRSENIARTISIEVGMQNSGLATVLAKQHFVADPMIAVPAAFSSVLHSILGSLLAGYWRLRPLSEAQTRRLGEVRKPRESRLVSVRKAFHDPT